MVARPTRKRMYRTMQGRMVDIEKLRMANESVQAVGNMKVNAKGDVLGAGGKVTDFDGNEILYGKKDFKNPSLILKRSSKL